MAKHETLTFHELEQRVANEYSKAAMVHAERSGGMLEVFPYDQTDPYDPQRLDVYHVEGSPVDPAVVTGLATVAYDRFPLLTKQLATLEQRNGTITQLGEALTSGKNVVVNANHGELIDPGITLAAYYVALKEAGSTFRSGIMLGKMLPFLKYRLGGEAMPAIDILKLVSNDMYLTMPNTPSREALDIDPQIAADYNAKSMLQFEKGLQNGGNLIVAIMTGTTEKAATGNQDVIPFEPIKHGAAKLILGENTIVVNTAVWLHGDGDPVFDICGTLRSVGSVEEVQNGMDLIISRLNERVPGKRFIPKASLPKALGHGAMQSLTND